MSVSSRSTRSNSSAAIFPAAAPPRRGVGRDSSDRVARRLGPAAGRSAIWQDRAAPVGDRARGTSRSTRSELSRSSGRIASGSSLAMAWFGQSTSGRCWKASSMARCATSISLTPSQSIARFTRSFGRTAPTLTRPPFTTGPIMRQAWSRSRGAGLPPDTARGRVNPLKTPITIESL